jgi:hypothetical protein
MCDILPGSPHYLCLIMPFFGRHIDLSLNWTFVGGTAKHGRASGNGDIDSRVPSPVVRISCPHEPPGPPQGPTDRGQITSLFALGSMECRSLDALKRIWSFARPAAHLSIIAQASR